MNGFTGVISGGNAKVAFEQGLHERGSRDKKLLPLLSSGGAPSLPEILVEGNDANSLAVRAVLLLERLDQLLDVGFVGLTVGVGLLGRLQKVGRKIEDEPQRVLLPPGLDLTTFLSVEAEGAGVRKICYKNM